MMLQRIKIFLHDLTDFNLEEPSRSIRDEIIKDLSPIHEEIYTTEEDIIKEPMSEDSSMVPEPQVFHCCICGKEVSANEEIERLKTQIEGIVSDFTLMGYECCIELLCHQCASSLGSGQQMALQANHFCFCWGNRDWNDELRTIAKYYGEEFAQQSRSNHEDLRHKVIVDDLDEYKIMRQVLRRINFRYPRKDISALLTEPEKRVYEKFTGKKING